MFSIDFYFPQYPKNYVRVILIAGFYDQQSPLEIADWLENSTSNKVYCCRGYANKSGNKTSSDNDVHNRDTAILFFESMDEAMLFKLSYNDIIYDMLTIH